jgi:protein involved in polysaccharide export with SLBB domain
MNSLNFLNSKRSATLSGSTLHEIAMWFRRQLLHDAALPGALLFLLCALGVPGGSLHAAPASKAPLRTDPFKAPPASYRLSANDLIHIKVFGEDELECSSRIARDGTVPFPLLGSISVGGKTVLEATSAIQSALRTYLINPQIALRILEYNKRRFTVLGQVNRPGTFDMPDDSPLSLLEAIGMAGGYSRLANPSKVTIRRSSPGGLEEILKVDAKRMAKSKTGTPFLLQPGDTVVIEESLF